MKRARWALLIVAVVAALTQPPARAHVVKHGLSHGCSQERSLCKYIARKTHTFFHHARHAHNAQRVLDCETGGTWWRLAGYPDGTYWGLFQFGPWARSTYGWSKKVWRQVRNAHELFVDNGYCWVCNNQWPHCGQYARP